MFKKIMGIGLLAVFSTSILASASTGNFSTAIIRSESFGEDGQISAMNGSVKVYGYNIKTGTNSLWVEPYKSAVGPDTRLANLSTLLPLGSAQASLLKSGTVTSGDYYIHLDPDGPLYGGSNGYGSLQN